MNKFQKVAVKMAKSDVYKELFGGFSKNRNMYYNVLKKNKYPIETALGLKNWNKYFWY